MVGYYTTGEARSIGASVRRVLRWRCWGLLLGAGFFLVPGVGFRLVAGPSSALLVTGLESAAVVGGLSAVTVGLIHLGVPKKMPSSTARSLPTSFF